MTSLSELNATFIRVRMDPAPEYIGRKLEDGTTQWGGFPSPTIYPVPNRLGAHGIRFMCPACFAKSQDPDEHLVQVFFRGEDVPGDLGRNMAGNEVRWDVEGQLVDELTLSPSISIGGVCHSHFFVKAGRIEIA